VKIQNTSTVAIGPLKMIVFGESGSGKTTLAKTIKEPTLIISAESGLLSLQGTNIDVIDLASDDAGVAIPKEKRITRLGDAYKFLLTDEAKKKYKTVFIDSLTEINQNMLEKLQAEYTDAKDTLKMYGELSKAMRSMVKMFRDLPGYSVIFTALSEIEKDEENKRYVNVRLIGKFSSEVSGYFDEVLYLHVERETGERVLITEKSDRLMSKDRSGKLEKREPADLGIVMAKIRAVPTPAPTKKEEKKS